MFSSTKSLFATAAAETIHGEFILARERDWGDVFNLLLFPDLVYARPMEKSQEICPKHGLLGLQIAEQIGRPYSAFLLDSSV